MIRFAGIIALAVLVAALWALYALAADYRVFGEGGWWDVRKCQACLASIKRERGPLFGSYVPLGLELTRQER